MKKIFLLLLTVVSMQESFAAGYTTNNNWRWKVDEGDLNSTNWYAPVSTTPTISRPGPLRLRLSTNIDGGFFSYTTTSADQLVLQYRTEPPSSLMDTQISPTVTAWKTVVVGDPATSTEPFVIEAAYSGPLVDKFTSRTSLITKTSGFGPTVNKYAPHEDVTTTTNQYSIGISKTNNASVNGQTINAGFYETEYRLVFTKNAKSGTAYYFRQFNLNTSGNAAGATDAWDNAAGFPNIVVSNNYNGVVNVALPNIGITFPAIGNSLTFTSGETKSGVLTIRNFSANIPSSDVFSGNFNVPSGWTVSFGTMPTGWSASGNTISSSSVIAGGGAVTIPYSITAPAITSGGVVSFSLGNIAGNAGGDGTAYNNRGSYAVYKP